MVRYLFFLLLPLLTASCSDHNTIIQEKIEFKNEAWLVGNEPTFDLNIEHPEAEHHFFCDIKNNPHYPYANLYLKWQLSDNEGVIIFDTLAELKLFDEKTGDPEGIFSNRAYHHSKEILTNFKFEEPGNYTIKLKQYMRKDSLFGMISAGVTVKQENELPRSKLRGN